MSAGSSVIGGGGASTSGGGCTIVRAARARGLGGTAARVATALTRWTGRSRASLTSATMTGVNAVAQIVPRAQMCETTSAATTDEAPAMNRVDSSTPRRRGSAGVSWDAVWGAYDICIGNGRATDWRPVVRRDGGTGVVPQL